MQRADHDSTPAQLELFPMRERPLRVWSSDDLRGLVDALAKLGTGGGFKNFFYTEIDADIFEMEIWISASFSPRKSVRREDSARFLKQHAESNSGLSGS